MSFAEWNAGDGRDCRLVRIHRRIPLERIFDCIGVKDTASIDPDRGGVFFQRSFRNCKKLKVTIQNAVMLPQSGCVLDRAGCFRTGQGKTVYVIFSDQGHGGHKKGQITGETSTPGGTDILDARERCRPPAENILLRDREADYNRSRYGFRFSRQGERYFFHAIGNDFF